MLRLVNQWGKQLFVEPESVILIAIIALIIAIVTLLGGMLAPALVSLVLAYLLEGLVSLLERMKIPHVFAAIVIYVLFLAAFLLLTFAFVPLLWHQLTNLVNEFPNMLNKGQNLLMDLPKRYPELISIAQMKSLILTFKQELKGIGQDILGVSVSWLPNAIMVVVYLVLVPLLVYFFIMDKRKLLQWVTQFIPKNRLLLVKVWSEVHAQIGNYVRGKVLEAIIVSLVCYIAFGFMHLNYAFLLAILVGLSVIIPYIGAVVVTVPVVIIALLQWGFSAQFAYLIITYSIIIAVDANVLVPLLFSEVMNLHPVAIILAVLFFGGIWGFWGVFFAIPFATVIKAVIEYWPRATQQEKPTECHD